MADMREDSPTYRRYVPFEPYAEVVREIFRLFVELDGNVYQTHRTLKARGIKFPRLKKCRLPLVSKSTTSINAETHTQTLPHYGDSQQSRLHRAFYTRQEWGDYSLAQPRATYL